MYFSFERYYNFLNLKTQIPPQVSVDIILLKLKN
jgi:hypothetical protein